MGLSELIRMKTSWWDWCAKKDLKSNHLFLPWEARTHQEGSVLQAKEETCTGTYWLCHLDMELVSLQNCEEYVSVIWPPGLSVLLQQLKLRQWVWGKAYRRISALLFNEEGWACGSVIMNHIAIASYPLAEVQLRIKLLQYSSKVRTFHTTCMLTASRHHLHFIPIFSFFSSTNLPFYCSLLYQSLQLPQMVSKISQLAEENHKWGFWSVVKILLPMQRTQAGSGRIS